MAEATRVADDDRDHPEIGRVARRRLDADLVRDPAAGEVAIRLAASADVIARAVPFAALDAVLAELGDLAGKTIIDCTNPMSAAVPEGSAAKKIAAARPAAHVVKSFNGQGFETLAAPIVGGTPASNFYCGDDAGAKATVRQLVADVGLDPVDAGALENARLLETLAALWFTTTAAFGTRRTAFRVLRESAK